MLAVFASPAGHPFCFGVQSGIFATALSAILPGLAELIAAIYLIATAKAATGRLVPSSATPR